MTSSDNKALFKGIGMAVVFVAVLFIMFSPVFRGQNAFEAADSFFNAMAKGSTYYMPDLLRQADAHKGKAIDVSLRLKDEEGASKAGKLLEAAGAKVSVARGEIKVSGDLGQISTAAIRDADDMFQNRGKDVAGRYGFAEKEVLYLWWAAFKEMEKELKKQKRFAETSWVATVSKKGLEVGYNFYGIEARKVSAAAGLLGLSLLFYVVYTLWWGFAILFLFEGLGLEMKPGAKKEV
jgi:hypothetical protein